MVSNATGNVLECEAVSPNGRKLFFRPIGRAIRGRVDFSTGESERSFRLKKAWPEPVPGQILGINLDTGEKYVREPLHDNEQTNNRQRVLGRGLALPPERVPFESESLVTWAYWLAKAIESGDLRIVRGKLPSIDSLDGEPRKHFITEPQQNKTADVMEKLVKTLDLNMKVMRAMLKKFSEADGDK